MRLPWISLVSLLLYLCAVPGLARAADSPSTTAQQAVFSQEQLDQMLAPIALYPDPLLAQVLMASTYPGEVAEAVAWSKANPKAQGDDAVKQVASQPWDPSVQALVAFPQILATLGQDPVWVQRLGDAFLAQPDALMASVQRLRRQAQAAGKLQSNPYQKVTTAPASSGDTTTIIIQPADPQVVYVPTYDPNTAYGTWAYPASPPVYYPPPPMYYAGSALVAGLAFGVGVAIIDSVWGDCDWGHNDIDIDVNRYNNINQNNQIINNRDNKWQHNATHRDGVPYRDPGSRERYGRQLAGADQRIAYRGDDARRAQERQQALGSLDRAGIQRPATSNRQARDQVRAAQPAVREQIRNRPEQRPAAGAGRARNNAFEGARAPSQARAQASRGRLSQASAQRPATARPAGQQISRPLSRPSRGGGGRR